MNVIGHQHVSSDEPRISISPDLPQQIMRRRLGQPWTALVSADRDENDSGLGK